MLLVVYNTRLSAVIDLTEPISLKLFISISTYYRWAHSKGNCHLADQADRPAC